MGDLRHARRVTDVWRVRAWLRRAWRPRRPASSRPDAPSPRRPVPSAVAPVDFGCEPLFGAGEWWAKEGPIVDSPRARALHAVDGFSHAGVRARTIALDLRDAGAWVLVLLDETAGTLAGGVQIALAEGGAEARLDHLDVFPGWRGRAIATAVEERLCAALRAAGVQRISLYAIRDGTYAWASRGYDFHSVEALRIHVETFGRDAIDQEVRAGRAIAEQADALFAALDAGEITTARAVSQYGRENAWTDDRGREMWIGRLPFDGVKWSGVKRLD